jgi:hypothetical protein
MLCRISAAEHRRNDLHLLIIVIIGLSSLCQQANAKFSLTYVNGSTITKEYFAAPIRFIANDYEFNEDAGVVAFDPNNLAFAANNFVVIPYNKPFTPFWEPVLALQDAGARGIIIDHPYFRKYLLGTHLIFLRFY